MSMVNVSNLGFGGAGVPDTLPKAIAELQGMRMDVVNGAAAGTVMTVPGMDTEDHIGAVVDLTTPASIDPTTLSVKGRNAEGTITCLTTAAEGDSVTVNGKKYTFKNIRMHPSYNTPPGVIPIDITPSGSDAEQMAERLSKAIMSGDSTVTAAVEMDTTASPPARTKVKVKVRQPGTAGNAYTLVETGNAANVSGATFSGGTAAGTAGFTSTANLSGKKILVVWYDRRPGQATNPLLYQAIKEADEPYKLEITELEPDSAEIGEPSFTLHVKGKGFGPDSKIIFNNHEEPTTFVSPTELTTGVNMDVWTAPSEPLPVKVQTGIGDASNEEMFQFRAAGAEALGKMMFRGGKKEGGKEDEGRKDEGRDRNDKPGTKPADKPKIGR